MTGLPTRHPHSTQKNLFRFFDATGSKHLTTTGNLKYAVFCSATNSAVHTSKKPVAFHHDTEEPIALTTPGKRSLGAELTCDVIFITLYA